MAFVKKLFACLFSVYIIVTGCTSLKNKEAHPVNIINLAVDKFVTGELLYDEGNSEAPSGRQYVFKDAAFFRDSLIIQLNFNEAGASVIRSGNFIKTLKDAFYTKKMSGDISSEYPDSRYNVDSLSIFSDTDKMALENVYAVTHTDKQYILFMLSKDVMNIGPYTNFYYLLFDCSKPEKIDCIAFRSLDTHSDNKTYHSGSPLDIKPCNGNLLFIPAYFKTVRTDTAKWETASYSMSHDSDKGWILKGIK